MKHSLQRLRMPALAACAVNPESRGLNDAAIATCWPAYLRNYRLNENPDAVHYVLLGHNLLLHGAYSRCESPPYISDMLRTPGYPVAIAGSWTSSAQEAGSHLCGPNRPARGIVSAGHVERRTRAWPSRRMDRGATAGDGPLDGCIELRGNDRIFVQLPRTGVELLPAYRPPRPESRRHRSAPGRREPPGTCRDHPPDGHVSNHHFLCCLCPC